MWLSPWGVHRCWLAAILLSLQSVAVANGDFPENALRRRILHFGNVERIKTAPLNQNLSTHIKHVRNRKTRFVEVEEVDVPASNKLWPPWPFNLLGRKSKSQDADDSYPSTGSLFWAYLRQRSRVGIRQIQQRKYFAWSLSCNLLT